MPFVRALVEVVRVAERDPLPGLPQSGKLSLDNSVKLFFALGNAIFDATGVRLRSVPFTPERLLAARQKRAA